MRKEGDILFSSASRIQVRKCVTLEGQSKLHCTSDVTGTTRDDCATSRQIMIVKRLL